MVLYLTIMDADTGETLAATVQRSGIVDGKTDFMEECRRLGVDSGLLAVEHWRSNGHPNAFANVSCRYERAAY